MDKQEMIKKVENYVKKIARGMTGGIFKGFIKIVC